MKRQKWQFREYICQTSPGVTFAGVEPAACRMQGSSNW